MSATKTVNVQVERDRVKDQKAALEEKRRRILADRTMSDGRRNVELRANRCELDTVTASIEALERAIRRGQRPGALSGNRENRLIDA